MPAQVGRDTYKRFYGAHTAYFEQFLPNPRPQKFNDRYVQSGAKALWGYYGTFAPHVKLWYRVNSPQAGNLPWTPPHLGNNWHGAPQPPPGTAVVPPPDPRKPIAAPSPPPPPPPAQPQLAPIQSVVNIAPVASQQAPAPLPAQQQIVPTQPVLNEEPIPAQPRTDFPDDPGRDQTMRDIPSFQLPGELPHMDPSNGFAAKNRRPDLTISDLLQTNMPTQQQHVYGLWQKGPSLGQGGFGVVHRWILLDGYGNEIDRLAIKDTNFWEDWTKIDAWSTDARDVPREIAAHRTVSASQDVYEDEEANRVAKNNILRFRGFRLIKWLRFYRMATNEANLDVLHTLADSFCPGRKGLNFRQQHEFPEIKSVTDERYEWIPTDFIWRVFRSLVRVCQYVNTHGLVHRDIKPDNVFLARDESCSDPDLGHYGMRLMLGDFGGSMPINPVRYENPTDFDSIGTLGYTAPEQYVGIPPLVPDYACPTKGYPMGEKTDVFMTAVTIWSVMVATFIDFKRGNVWPFDEPEKYKKYAKYHVTNEDQYIDRYFRTAGSVPDGQNIHNNDLEVNNRWMKTTFGTLTGLLHECLRFRPENRPTLEELAVEIEKRHRDWLDDEVEEDIVEGASEEDDEEAKRDAGNRRFAYWFGHHGPIVPWDQRTDVAEIRE